MREVNLVVRLSALEEVRNPDTRWRSQTEYTCDADGLQYKDLFHYALHLHKKFHNIYFTFSFVIHLLLPLWST
jgi:hypothetical protein